MPSGSVASSFRGEPRATRDVDLAIDAVRDQLLGFVRAVQERDWYVDDSAALKSLRAARCSRSST